MDQRIPPPQKIEDLVKRAEECRKLIDELRAALREALCENERLKAESERLGKQLCDVS